MPRPDCRATKSWTSLRGQQCVPWLAKEDAAVPGPPGSDGRLRSLRFDVVVVGAAVVVVKGVTVIAASMPLAPAMVMILIVVTRTVLKSLILA